MAKFVVEVSHILCSQAQNGCSQAVVRVVTSPRFVCECVAFLQDNEDIVNPFLVHVGTIISLAFIYVASRRQTVPVLFLADNAAHSYLFAYGARQGHIQSKESDLYATERQTR